MLEIGARIAKIGATIDSAINQAEYIKQQIGKCQDAIFQFRIEHENLQKARWVLVEVAKDTQQNFKDDVEPLVTMAIQSVFQDRNFEFELKFEQKRKKLECLPIIKEDGYELTPKDEMGGSILDVIGFALRVVLWAMETPRSRATFFMDEPFKWTGKFITRAGSMMKEISDDLNIQIIMFTHDDALIDISNTCQKAVHNGKFTEIEMVKADNIFKPKAQERIRRTRNERN